MKKIILILVSIGTIAACNNVPQEKQKQDSTIPKETIKIQETKVEEDIPNLVSEDAVADNDHYEKLRFFAERGNLKEVENLITYGVNINKLKIREDLDEYYEDTPLMLAGRKGHLDVVNLLLKHGANVNQITLAAERDIEPGDDSTALELACSWNHMDVVMTLAKAGTNARSILYCACTKGNEELLKMALEKKVPLDTIYGQGFSPLMLAAERGYSNIVKTLIEAGADVNYNNDFDGEKYTVLDAAKVNGHLDTAEILKAAGAKE